MYLQQERAIASMSQSNERGEQWANDQYTCMHIHHYINIAFDSAFPIGLNLKEWYYRMNQQQEIWSKVPS